MYHVEVFHHDKLIDIHPPRYSRKSEAAIAATEAAADSEEWRIDLQARFDAQTARELRSMVIDDDDATDIIGGHRRIAPHYTYIAAKCNDKHCNH